jgi:menaquinone-dependent protoporphyrinogen oxidase
LIDEIATGAFRAQSEHYMTRRLYAADCNLRRRSSRAFAKPSDGIPVVDQAESRHPRRPTKRCSKTLRDREAGVAHHMRALHQEVSMKAAVFFATREGQTRKIADRIAVDLRTDGLDVELHDVRTLGGTIDWSQYAVACVAASVHGGHHEKEMIDFARRYRPELERLAAVFVSVTLSEAGAEDLHASPDQRERSAADARTMIDVFIEETGWRPARTLPVAGALAYSKYNILIRFVMKRIARKQGAPTDTSRDYEYTNWPALDQFVHEVAGGAGPCMAR